MVFARVVGLLDNALPVQPIAATRAPESVGLRLVLDLLAADRAQLVGRVVEVVGLLIDAMSAAERGVRLVRVVEAVERVVYNSAVQMELYGAGDHRAADHRPVVAAIAALESSAALDLLHDVFLEEAFEALVNGAVLLDSRTEEDAVVVGTDAVPGHHLAQPVLVAQTRPAEDAGRLYGQWPATANGSDHFRLDIDESITYSFRPSFR